MSNAPVDTHPDPVGPPSKHQLALMIWIAVFPTLTILNLTLKPWLKDHGPRPANLRAGDHRRPDRHLRPHAAAAQAPGTHPDPPAA